jgi:anion-transporting  ArsA/GET3 family ATPase
MPLRSSRLSPAARRSSSASASRLLEEVLGRRIVFVAGKGGTGRTTVSAALALLGARAGKRVLAVDVDAKGDLAVALGARQVGFAPVLVQPGISALELRAEESFQEYLNVYFKVPRLARLTPLARVFDFIATGVPGPRDMLVVGKIAFEERRREPNSRPVWDLIVVDCAASGHVVSHLSAAHTMLALVRGGIIKNQVEWIDQLVRDARRSTVVLTALPQEMPVVEAIELYGRLREEAGVAVSACVLSRMVMTGATAAQRRLVAAMTAPEHAEALRARLGGASEPLGDALEIADQLHRTGEAHARKLRTGLPVPVATVPLLVTRGGLATSRTVADTLAEAMA